KLMTFKVLAAGVIAAGLFAGAAQAQPTVCQQVGVRTVCNGPGGTSTSQQVGGQRFTTHGDGTSSTSETVGG
ncbi:hypothetical protein, partial [Salmonella enterica]|uniref:hypothetical protein n=1 Tax=Salmonella enterica TaxID=28901 RepID=UPI003CED3DB7